MSGFEDTLNKILSSPEDMEKLAGLAKTLSASLGGGAPGAEAPPEGDSAAPAGAAESGAPGIDPKLLGLLGRLLGEYNAPGASDKTALFAALRPYLKESQRDRLTRAAELSKLARLAKAAMKEFSGGENFGV